MKNSTKKKTKMPEPPEKGFWGTLRILFSWRSLLLGIIGLFLLKIAVTTDRGYDFVYNRLLLTNWRYINKNKQFSLDERLFAKLGFSYAIMAQIKENTPDSAVILFPKKEYILEKGSQEIRPEVAHKVWVTSFLYPRKIVYEDERGKNPFFDKADFVVIMNGKGYNLIEYEWPEKGEYALLPVKEEMLHRLLKK
ncbi:MAG: hypothetical protein PUB21_02230 [Bacteroidales bacterium]|nr:hypothetical protein [Bacteroidales bacterium]